MTKTPIRPTPSRIIVEEDAFRYEGRIVIPEKVQRRPTTGKIVAIGANVSNHTFKIGDRVVYGLYSGTVVNFRGRPALRVLTEEDVLGVVEIDLELEGVGT